MVNEESSSIDHLRGSTRGHPVRPARACCYRGASRAFGAVHLLPFFHPIDGTDAGFDPIDHTGVDPRLGDWEDVRALGAESTSWPMSSSITSPAVRSSSGLPERGAEVRLRGMFLTFDECFPQGASECDLLRSIVRGPACPSPRSPWRTARGAFSGRPSRPSRWISTSLIRAASSIWTTSCGHSAPTGSGSSGSTPSAMRSRRRARVAS